MAKTFIYALSLYYCVGSTLSSLTLSPENLDDKIIGGGSLSYKKVDEDQFWNKYEDQIAGGTKNENVYALPVPASVSTTDSDGVQKNFQELKKEAENYVHKKSERVSFPSFASESGSIRGTDSSRLENEIYQRPSAPETHTSSSGYEMSKEQKYDVDSGDYVAPVSISYVASVVPVITSGSLSSGKSASLRSGSLSAPVVRLPISGSGGSSYSYHSYHSSSSYGGGSPGLSGGSRLIIQPGDVSDIGPSKKVYGLSTSFSSKYENKNGKVKEERHAVVKVNDNGKVVTYETRNK